MKDNIPKISLDEMKRRLMKQYNVSPVVRTKSASSVGFDKSVDEMLLEISKFMLDHPEETIKLADSIGKGEDFRYYFSDLDAIKELALMRKSDPDSFYRILKKEELFINYIIRTMPGYEKVIVSLGPEYIDRLLQAYEDFDDSDLDFDEQ